MKKFLLKMLAECRGNHEIKRSPIYKPHERMDIGTSLSTDVIGYKIDGYKMQLKKGIQNNAFGITEHAPPHRL